MKQWRESIFLFRHSFMVPFSRFNGHSVRNSSYILPVLLSDPFISFHLSGSMVISSSSTISDHVGQYRVKMEEENATNVDCFTEKCSSWPLEHWGQQFYQKSVPFG